MARLTRWPALLREARVGADAVRVTERHLQAVWFDPRWRPDGLATADGQSVTVRDPGRWNLEAGPDFLDAILEVGAPRRQVRGDVEAHLRPADWTAHGHAADPAYRRVIAHVTYQVGVLPAAELPPGALQIALRPVLLRRPEFGFDALDLAAYPHAALLPRPPCARALADATPAERGAVLDGAGEERLRRKCERLRAALEQAPHEQVVYAECLAALGFKHNRQPFRALAGRLPLGELRERAGGDPAEALALLMGVSGLLPTRVEARWSDDGRAAARALWDRWWRHADSLAERVMARGEWRLDHLRPANHPLRRLAAAALLFGGPVTLADRLERLVGHPVPPVDADAALFDESSADALAFWRGHATFGATATIPAQLVGPARRAAIMINLVAPLLAARGALPPGFLDALPDEDDNSLVRATAARLFGRDHNPALHAGGLRRQGLIQIAQDFCLANPDGCRACPLAAALGAVV